MKDIMQKLAELEATAPKAKKMLTEDTVSPIIEETKDRTLKNVFQELSETATQPFAILDPQNKQSGVGVLKSNNPAVDKVLQALNPKEVQVVQTTTQGQQPTQTTPAPAGATGQPVQGQQPMREKDEGKPGKNFAKIAKSAGERYGSKAAGERVAGAVRAKLAKQGKLEEEEHDYSDYEERNMLDDLYDMDLPKPGDSVTIDGRHGIVKSEVNQDTYGGPAEFEVKYDDGTVRIHSVDTILNGDSSYDDDDLYEEQLDELSPDTLGNYLTGTSKEAPSRKAKYDAANKSGDMKSIYKAARKEINRSRGQKTAFSKMTGQPVAKGTRDVPVPAKVPAKSVAEGAKVDRMVKHIEKSERKLGKSKDKASDIAWATANKRGMLDNKNKKKVKEGDIPSTQGIDNNSPLSGSARSMTTLEGIMSDMSNGTKVLGNHHGFLIFLPSGHVVQPTKRPPFGQSTIGSGPDPIDDKEEWEKLPWNILEVGDPDEKDAWWDYGQKTLRMKPVDYSSLPRDLQTRATRLYQKYSSGQGPNAFAGRSFERFNKGKTMKNFAEGKWNYPEHMKKTVTTSDMGTTNAQDNRDARREFRKKEKAKAHAELMKGGKKVNEANEAETHFAILDPKLIDQISQMSGAAVEPDTNPPTVSSYDGNTVRQLLAFAQKYPDRLKKTQVLHRGLAQPAMAQPVGGFDKMGGPEYNLKEGKKKAKPDFLDMDKDGNKKESMKKAVADKKKKTVKEGLNGRISAARHEGRADGLRGGKNRFRDYDDLEEARAYHEGYKDGLDECYGQGVYENAPAATVPGMADQALEGNAFTDALARTPKGGKFSLGGKTFTDRTSYDSLVREGDFAFESLDKQLNDLLNEGLSVSVSKGQQNAPDSVTITAQDAEADQLLQLVKHAGLGLFGDDTPAEPSQAMSIAPTSGEPDEVGAGGAEIDVVDDSDGMLALMKKLGGVEASGSDDYANEEGEETCNECGGMMEADHTCSNCHDSSENTAVVDEFLDVTVAQKGMGGDSGSSSGVAGVTSTGGTSGATGGFSNANAQSGSAADADAQARADAKSTSNESESPDQEEFEVAEDNAPDSDEAETSADEDAEADEDKALALKNMNESFFDLLHRLDNLSEGSGDKPKHPEHDKKDDKDYDDAEDSDDEEDVTEGLNEWANQVGKGPGKGTDASFEQDIEFMTKVIAGGLNKPKSTGQTTVPIVAGQIDRMVDTPADWATLAGIKK